ncbi:hypothetical protein TNCV_1145311 [Trichonephila clavipes]|nr:hypothetical protein TNCV_1145311 [Trichonephila clavipes]
MLSPHSFHYSKRCRQWYAESECRTNRSPLGRHLATVNRDTYCSVTLRSFGQCCPLSVFDPFSAYTMINWSSLVVSLVDDHQPFLQLYL